MKTKRSQFNLITILLVCVSLLSVSCGGGSGNGGGGTEPGETASITLSVSPSSIPANGASSLTITATLRDSTGAAVDRGTSVEFNTTLGTFPNESTTYSASTPTEGGNVTVSLIAATTQGTARITAESNNITQTIDVEFTVQVVGSVTVISGSPQLLADGVSQTEISATVKDTSDHNMPDGTMVYFSTDLGTLSADSATTTNGQAAVTLTSSTLVGTATITATTAFVSGDAQVTFVPGDVAAISLKATPNNLTADGHSTSTITATVTDAHGNLVTNGKSISFSVSTGTGTLSANTATTVNGVATVTYTASFTALIETVRAQAANGTMATVDIVLINQTVGSVSVSAGSSVIVADGFSQTMISATIKDLSGINVRDGIIVSFTSTAGTLSSPSATTVNGVATVALRSPTNLGFAEVRATAGGVNDTVTVNFVPGPPFRLTVLAIPATVQIHGTSSIEVIVYDQYDNPVANGETLTFTAQFGTVSPLLATTSGGMASVTYTAPSTIPPYGRDTITVQATNGRQGIGTITVTRPSVTGITLTANPTGLPADGASQSTITATVTVSGGGKTPDGMVVNFSITSGGGTITPSATTSNGSATAVLTSGTITGTAVIRAEAEGVSGTIAVQYTATPASLSLGLSQATVRSDNSDSSTITATVLDANFAVVEGITVTFTSNGGQLSTPSCDTDIHGEAIVDFSSGTTDRSNRVVTITATVPGLPSAQIPVQVTGTTLTLVTNTTNLEIGAGGNNQANLTITARDAGSVPIYNATIDITSSPSGIVSVSPATGTTNVTGQIQVTVTAMSAGDVTVRASGLGAIGTQNYSVGVVGDVFTITAPTDDPHSASTGGSVTVTVNAPSPIDEVQFATTLGDWDATGQQVRNVTVSGGVASAVLESSEAGTANILVSDVDNPSTSDSLTVLFSAPSSEAANISLQASATVVAPSTGGVSNSVNLTATVKNAGGQVVGGAAVAFSLVDTTGGGEFVSPPVAYTNSYGIAEGTFTSGSLSSDAQGVTVIATVVDTSITDSLQIIIGGTGGSVVIGMSTTLSSINGNTAYSLPGSVLVSDSNGNPVSGAIVTLNLWPSYYRTGCFAKIGEEWAVGDCVVDPAYYPVDDWFFKNEDDWYGEGDARYRNLVLDPGEDRGPGPGVAQGESPDVPNPDGQLTPPPAAAGSIPGTVVTDANGVGQFNLVYLKSSAIWIVVEITASTVVSGTENQGELEFVLPYAVGDEEHLPSESPYNYLIEP
ncbi:MAG: Ig-like domain-containing protein [Deltaproteobacteria bacterium]|nr:Ig-like domain-containing protein [Deltaproteobacteria bacterium]